MGQKRNKGRAVFVTPAFTCTASISLCVTRLGQISETRPSLKRLILRGSAILFSPCASRFSGGRGYLSDRRPPLTVILPSADGERGRARVRAEGERAGFPCPRASDTPALCPQGAKIRGWTFGEPAKKCLFSRCDWHGPCLSDSVLPPMLHSVLQGLCSVFSRCECHTNPVSEVYQSDAANQTADLTGRGQSETEFSRFRAFCLTFFEKLAGLSVSTRRKIQEAAWFGSTSVYACLLAYFNFAGVETTTLQERFQEVVA